MNHEPIVARTINRLLKLLGRTVDCADNGNRGLAMFLAAKHDLVLCNLCMNGIGGLELAAEIQSAAPATPIILITAYAERIKVDTS